MYGGSCGGELPHALATLLIARPGAIAIGTFPADVRTGTDTFWAECAAVGLQATEQRCAGTEMRLYVFTATEGTAPAQDWGGFDDAPAMIEPLFADDSE